MGDAADMCLDQMFDPEYDYAEDDPDVWQRDDSIWFPKSVTCYKCHKGRLHWHRLNGNWVLHDATGIHMCKPAVSIDVDVANLAKVKL